VTPNYLKPPQFLHFALPCIFVIGDRKDFKFDLQLECASHSLYGRQTVPGRGQVM